MWVIIVYLSFRMVCYTATDNRDFLNGLLCLFKQVLYLFFSVLQSKFYFQFSPICPWNPSDYIQGWQVTSLKERLKCIVKYIFNSKWNTYFSGVEMWFLLDLKENHNEDLTGGAAIYWRIHSHYYIGVDRYLCSERKNADTLNLN